MIYNTQKGKNIAAAKRMSLSEFIERSHIKHNHKYTYEEVTYVNAHTHINIKCPDHGIWSQTPMDHLTGCGCPICGNIQKGKAKSLSAFKKFLEFAKNKHNEKYDYDTNSYMGMTKPMTIICPIHGEFNQSPDVHKRAGCQRCGSGPVSLSSQLWLDSLGIDIKLREKWIVLHDKKIKVDAYDPNNNTIYEFWGNYWHGNPRIYDSEKYNSTNKIKFKKLYDDTISRIDLIESEGYNLIQIWEDEWSFMSKNNSSL